MSRLASPLEPRLDAGEQLAMLGKRRHRGAVSLGGPTPSGTTAVGREEEKRGTSELENAAASHAALAGFDPLVPYREESLPT